MIFTVLLLLSFLKENFSLASQKINALHFFFFQESRSFFKLNIPQAPYEWTSHPNIHPFRSIHEQCRLKEEIVFICSVGSHFKRSSTVKTVSYQNRFRLVKSVYIMCWRSPMYYILLWYKYNAPNFNTP